MLEVDLRADGVSVIDLLPQSRDNKIDLTTILRTPKSCVPVLISDETFFGEGRVRARSRARVIGLISIIK